MTERQDVAAAPAPWSGAGGPFPAAAGAAEGSLTEVASPATAAGVEGEDGRNGAAGSIEELGEQRPAGSAADDQVPAESQSDRPGRVGRAGSAGAGNARTIGSRPGDRLRQQRRLVADEEPSDEPYARVDARKLENALLGLRKPLVSVPLPLEAPGVEQARAERHKLLNQIDDYLLPRLRQSGAPILVALVGSTGAGKSTLLNSLAGKQVSATGIRRPTTNSPVLACHPNDMRWFAENVFLPTLPRVRQQGLAMPGRDGLLVLAATEGMPEGVAVLDTPDIDSVVKAHLDFANQFLDASDLWLFVTTARRYADAAVWEMLKDARDRGAALAIALSRVPRQATRQVAAHFDAMLEVNGLRDVRRFIIPETVITDAMLPGDTAAPVHEYLADTAKRDDRRVAVLTQTMAGVLDTFRDRVPNLAGQAATQLTIQRELIELVDSAYADALAEFDEATRNGSLLRGEVLARWQDFAGTGDLLKTLQVRRGRTGKTKKQRLPARASALNAALSASLDSLIAATADRAAEQAVFAWQENPAGAALLADATARSGANGAGEAEPDFVASALADLGITDGSASPDPIGASMLARYSADLPVHAARAIGTWQEAVLRLVQEEKVTKRSIARVVSFDEESLALVLTIAVLGYGSADAPADDDVDAVPQRLLASLFGVGLLRDIGVRVRLDLHERVSLLLAEESRRFAEVLEAAGAPDQGAATELLQAGFTLEGAR